jgi:hypothetical protein
MLLEHVLLGQVTVAGGRDGRASSDFVPSVADHLGKRAEGETWTQLRRSAAFDYDSVR